MISKWYIKVKTKYEIKSTNFLNFRVYLKYFNQNNEHYFLITNLVSYYYTVTVSLNFLIKKIYKTEKF